jgi:hypothetical protein
MILSILLSVFAQLKYFWHGMEFLMVFKRREQLLDSSGK